MNNVNKEKLILEAKRILQEFKEARENHEERLKIYPDSTYRHPVLYLYYDIRGEMNFGIYHELKLPCDCWELIEEYYTFEFAEQHFINDILRFPKKANYF